MKRYPIQASELAPGNVRVMTANSSVDINWFQVEGKHLLVEVSAQGGINGFYNWYAFAPHCEVWDNGKKLYPPTVTASSSEILLKVPFFPQTDNRFDPNRTCNTSSCAMVAKFLGAKIKGDDEYYQHVIKYGDTTDHSAQTKALLDVGVKSTWNTNLDFADLDKSLVANKPVVIGILHRGSEAYPTGGHMIVVRGKTKSGDYWINDPYGDCYTAYTTPVEDGNCVVYTRKTLTCRWTVDGKSSGWGRLF